MLVQIRVLYAVDCHTRGIRVADFEWFLARVCILVACAAVNITTVALVCTAFDRFVPATAASAVIGFVRIA